MEAFELAGVPDFDAIAEELELRDLVRFIPKMSPRFMEPRHLAPLLRRFELAADGVPQRVCCSAPPRHGKSEAVFHVPAFTLRRHPEVTLSYSTYGDRLSRRGSRKARKLCEAAGVIVDGNVNEWRTKEGGGLLAGGVGGPLTGFGVNIAIVDDPVKNRIEAESATYRARLIDWYRDVLATRIEPGGSVFVFMTRWNEDDLIGELVREGFEYINLPALDADEAALWPERWPADALKKRREEVGIYTWESLYQGRPRPRGESVFGDAHVYSELPTIYRAAGGMDAGYSAKTSSDPSAYVKMLYAGGNYYVTHAWWGRTLLPALRARLRVVHDGEPTMRWRWYTSTTEKGVADLFDEGDEAVPVRSVNAKASKLIRAQRYAAAYNAGKVLVPRNAPWLEEFLAQHAAFTGADGGRDDIIDAAVAAFDELEENASNTGPVTASSAPYQPLRDARI